MQRRTLFNNQGGAANRIMNYRRLNKLEQEANASPTDVLKQATLYKVIKKGNFFFLCREIYIKLKSIGMASIK